MPLLLLLRLATQAPGDDLDRFIRQEMTRRQVPGMSIAIIQDGKIEARAYGVIEKGTSRAVTTETLFQAGSISKPVAAVGALRLVEQGRLSLESPVNDYLTSWKVPANRFTATRPVTLAGILSHTAGLTVHGFPGYAANTQVASVLQVLDGTPPANTAAIRVDTTPGSLWRYSGGGYTVMQQMVVDVTGRGFPELLRETVLLPFGMTSSSYSQPLPADLAVRTASGHYQDRSYVEGRWHIYPEMAAAGLWTTATDLARFAVGIQETLAGRTTAVLSQAMARRLTTEVMGGYGLGLALSKRGEAPFFGHNGRDEGFDALLTASAAGGQGLVVLMNVNDNSGMGNRIREFVARKYGWPGVGAEPAPVARDRSVRPAALRALAGRYEFRNNFLMTLVATDSTVEMLTDNLPDLEFVPVGPDRFAAVNSGVDFAVLRDAKGIITGLRWVPSRGGRVIPRVGPFVDQLPRWPQDAGVSQILFQTLAALRQGGETLRLALTLTPGARRDFAGVPRSFFNGMDDVEFLAMETVAGRGIERHDAAVARIAYFSFVTPTAKRFLLVHLTAEGRVTDLDVVDR